MRILVVSDNHGRDGNLVDAIQREGKLDLALHLGDSEFPAGALGSYFDCPLVAVGGNCDFGSGLAISERVEIPGHRLFLSHGHYFDVRWGLEDFMDVAKGAGADVAVFGHTHVPMLEKRSGLTILNPGSLELPRQESHLCSYALITADRGGRLHIEIKYLED